MSGRAPGGERGSGLVEVTWLGLGLIVPLVWIVLAVFDVQRGAFGVSAAARAAARSYALAPSDEVGRERALQAARQVLADHGEADAPLTVEFHCVPATACHDGGSSVTVTVRSRVDVPVLPVFLGGAAPEVPIDAAETVPIGRYQETSDG